MHSSLRAKSGPPDESNRRSVENYGLVRAAEDMMYDLQIVAIFYSRLLKKNFAVEIIPKKNKVEKISESLWANQVNT